MSEVVLDSKGRIALPKGIRETLGLREGVRVKVTVEGKRIVLAPPVSPDEFVREMEGYVKREIQGEPLEVKKIWEPKVR